MKNRCYQLHTFFLNDRILLLENIDNDTFVDSIIALLISFILLVHRLFLIYVEHISLFSNVLLPHVIY